MSLRLMLRFAAPLVAVLGAMAILLTPLVDRLMTEWFRSDVEARSRLVFHSIQDSLLRLDEAREGSEIVGLFDTVALDERVLALALCGADGTLRQASRNWPRQLRCPGDPAPPGGRFALSTLPGGSVLTSSFPLDDPPGLRSVVIAHDMTFAANRSWSARLYLMALIATLGLAAALVTILVARLTLRDWLQSVRLSLAGGNEPADRPADPDLAPVVAQVQQLLRDLDVSQAASAGVRVDWSPESLRGVVRSELPGAEVIVVSNREPYIHNRNAEGEIGLQRPASGLVTALEPIIKACGGTWIAHGSGSADRETVDRNDRLRVPPDQPAYTLRRIWLSEAEERGYYYGLANEGLWPLCHISYVRPVFRESDWEAYVEINRRFARAVVEEATSEQPLVLVQDYHLALVPRFVREALPQATIVTFWHIPWPNAEVFGICPWRERILDGLLGSTVVGFHTQLHCNNFIESADRFLECHINRENATVSVGGTSSVVRPYPISIEWPPEAMAGQPSPEECRAQTLAAYDLPPETVLAVGVERFDFTKGIPDRLKAVDILLERSPEWRGRFVLLQVAAPTRASLPAYEALRQEALAVAAEVNERHGFEGYRPIILETRHFEPQQVYTLLRAADVCIVSSLHDGMNLVAKEFVAARDDERGVLILSTFAGASRELMEALIVNPFDARATADAIDRALRMPPAEQGERMQLMRATVSENNIFYWAGRLLLDASRLRKRARIHASIARMARRG